MKVHPRGRSDTPLLGVFATRTPYRPNPIGITLVEVLEVEDNVVTVRGLDAFDGTPVLDLKPFDYWDMVEDARIPEWWTRLEEKRIL
ncbi:MAG: S-adenosylmethionine-dependent methyltransferase [Candidatus Bathyarchaeum sp.]|nr:MAG: S-adenosylmethionine-dependent methyltransferase [Candidatus Bathyarchaeum sp.]